MAGLGLCAALTIGCEGPFRDQVAATVGDEAISFEDVEALASELDAGAAAEPGRVSAASRRLAVGYLVQDRVFAAELARREVSVSPADEQQAAEILDAVGQASSGELRSVLEGILASQLALARLEPLEVSVDDEAIERFAEENAEALAGIACLEGVQVEPEGIDQVQRSLDDGASFEDLAAEGLGVPLGQAGVGVCTQPGTTGDPAIEAAIFDSEVGEVQTVEVEGMEGPAALVLRVTSRPATLSDPVLRDLIRAELEAQSQATGDQATILALSRIVPRVLGAADVSVDPRLGRLDVADVEFDPRGMSVVAPARLPRSAGLADDIVLPQP